MYDTIIIGCGPAGMSSAIFLKRSNKNILLLEAYYYGGQIVNTNKIENYPTYDSITGVDFANKLYNQIVDLGSEIKYEKAIKINNYDDYKEVVTNKNTYKTKTIILATGLVNKSLGVEHEKELVGKGISYCATCDGAFYKNKDVAIIGENNNSIEDAIYLSSIANKVHFIYRKNDIEEHKKLLSIDNIIIYNNSNIKELLYDQKLNGIIIKKENEEIKIDVNALFISIGRVPENENFKSIIDTDENGYIISGEDCHTNVDGIYACGDNRTKSLRQLVTATSDGAIAAMEAIKYINKK